MPELPQIAGAEAVKTFERAGWKYARRKGSHMIMTKPGVSANLSIPDHKVLDRGLLRKLIRLSRLTVEEFIKLHKQGGR